MSTKTVAALQQFADAHEKDIVVILSWDAESGVTNIASWGREVDHKRHAADAADRIKEVLFSDSPPAEIHEDYRIAGEAAQEVDRLRSAIVRHQCEMIQLLNQCKPWSASQRCMSKSICDLVAVVNE